MNGLESILRNGELAREIAAKVSLVQPAQPAAGGGGESIREGAPAGFEGAKEGAPAGTSAATPGVIFEPAQPGGAAETPGDPRETLNVVVANEGFNEAIIRRFGRPVLLVRNNTFEIPASDTWATTLIPNKSKLDAVIPAVGRVEVVSSVPPYIGTAWMVTSDIAVTNRHVALEFASRRQDGRWDFRRSPNGQVMRMRVDFKEEHLQTVTFNADIVEIIFIAENSNTEPDLAFLRLRSNGLPLPPPLPLFDGTLRNRQKVAVIGYPAEDSRNGAADQSRIFANIFDVKRLAPGELTGVDGGAVFKHDCTTLGGNSGSPVVDIETGAVAGLHFAGEYLLNNYAVPAATVLAFLRRIDSDVVIPALPPAPELATFEVTAEQVQGREGYQEEFLGDGKFAVPLPTLTDSLADRAYVVDEGAEGTKRFSLDYTHFSLAMHADRRMAIFTASNIDGELSRNIKRKKDAWGFDPRIPREVQIGNELYVGNDLDRGHLVRRLDPVWGTPAVAKKAELDTFFFTNCTPQHSDFNQKLWLNLEDHLLGNIDTRNFRACVFTGPVFTRNDRLYRDVLLPQSYWKVVAMIHDERDELTATAYVVSQRSLLSDLEFVFGQFRTYQVPIADIERRTGLDFGDLKRYDPLGQQEAAVIRELVSPEDLIL